MAIASPVVEIPVAEDVIFSDHRGRRRSGIERKQRTLLRKATPLLKVVLAPDEKVLLVAEAVSPISVLDYLTTGWLVALLRQCLLVVTERRILQIPAKYGFVPASSISQIRFEDLESAAVTGGLGQKLKLKYGGGKKEQFTHLRGAAAKKLKQLLVGKLGMSQASLALGRVYLCPRCARPLEPDADRCGGCDLAFKTKAKALKYSLLVPGGGYFYTGHPLLGIGDAIVETLLIVLVIASLIGAVGGDPDPNLWVSVAFFSALLAWEKLVSVYHANHYAEECLPADAGFRVA